MAEAWNTLVERHGSLRTRFAGVEGEPVQVVESHLRFNVQEIDLSLLSLEAADAEADRIAGVEARTPFDIGKAPLARVTHVRLSVRSSILMVTVHHMICDGWSLGILAREMGALLAAQNTRVPLELVPLARTYCDYAQTAQGQAPPGDRPEERSYLRSLTEGVKRVELPPDFERSDAPSNDSAIASTLLDRATCDRFVGLAKRSHSTPFMLAYSILLVLLHKWTRESNLALTTQVTGRDDVETEPIVGTFVNTLMLRTLVDESLTFAELVDRARDNVLDAFEMRHLPMRMLIEALGPKRTIGRNPLSSINFIFQRTFIENRDYGSFRLTDLPSRSSGAMFDLNIFMVERPEGWRLSCEYDVSLYDRTTIDALLERFVHLIETFARDTSLPIRDVSLFTERDRRAIADFNVNSTQSVPVRLLLDAFGAHVAQRPDDIAVECGKAALTYDQVDRASESLGAELKRRSLPARARVGILLDRSVDVVSSILATLKAGYVFVLFDPNLDVSTLQSAVRSAELDAIIAKTLPAAVSVPADCTFIKLEPGMVVCAPSGERFERGEIRPDDRALAVPALHADGGVTFVELSHGAVASTFQSLAATLSIEHGDRMLAATTVSSDLAVVELLLPLFAGAKLIIATDVEIGEEATIGALIDRHHVSLMLASSTSWMELLEKRWRPVPSLRAVCVGPPIMGRSGEELLRSVKELWYAFGLPEAGIVSSVARARQATDLAYVVAPLSSSEMILVDDRGEPVAPSVRGELTIAGSGIGTRYIGAPDLTETHFRRRADGTAVFYSGLSARLLPRGIALDADQKVRYTNSELDADTDTAAIGARPDGPSPTELAIFGIAATLLGHERFAATDDMFTVGLHSLLAMKLRALINERFSVEFPLRAIFEHPTIAEIAARLDLLHEIRSWEKADSTAITPLNASGDRPPFFFFHGDVASEGMYTRRLATTLGADQPINVIAAHGTAGLPPLASVEEMAADHVLRIRQQQPNGPYRLAGFCVGGLIAYEVARRLIVDGEDVERLVLINASALPKRSLPFFDATVRGIALSLQIPARLRMRLCYGLAWVHGALANGPVSIVRFLRERLPTLIRPRELAWVYDEERTSASQSDNETAFAYVIASSFSYHPKSYPRRLTLIWGNGQNTDVVVPEREWQAVAREVEVINVDGGHADLLNENLENLSAALTQAMAERPA